MKQDVKKELVRKFVKKEAKAAAKLADAITDFAELGFSEHRSSEALAEYLGAHGFKVEFPWPHIPTAFRAEYGSGKPSMGMLAEYDALPGCGMKPGTNGHGCGHSLLGVGAAVAAVATAAALKEKKKSGKVVLWGCPAEEMLAGKAYMARDGAFRDNDVILGWHPGSVNRVSYAGGSALDSVLFEFYGKTSHGAHADKGRSALDGVMLLDVAANYLREHVPDNVRIHMCVHSGGDAPNVVPGYASAWYYVRGRDRVQVDEIRMRLKACAEGAAMATETKMKMTRLTGIYNRLVSDSISHLLLANLELFGAPRATAVDRKHVRKLGKKPNFATDISSELDAKPGFASSDEASVSWLAPMGVFTIACQTQGTTGHHRECTAQMKLPFAHRGMFRGAEVMAGAALDLFFDMKLLRRARAEFRKRTRGFKFDPLIPRKQDLPTKILSAKR